MNNVVNVTQMAIEAGFDIPVFVTDEVWDKCVAWNDEDNVRQGYQEEDARLWDVLFVPSFKIKNGIGYIGLPDGMPYEIYCLLRDKNESTAEAELINLHVLPVRFSNDNSLLITF